MGASRRAIAVTVLLCAVVVQLAVFIYGLERRAERSAPFRIEISPAHVPDGAVGRESTLTVKITEEGDGEYRGEAINLTAIVPGATFALVPSSVLPGELATLLVTPDEGSEGRNVTVTIYGRRGRREKTTATIMVIEP